jgi:hypothetical protein
LKTEPNQLYFIFDELMGKEYIEKK